jgi:peroxiredoxin
LAGYRDRFVELASLGFGLAAVSVDAPERSRALTAQLQLPFPLLSDMGREVVQAYGVFNRSEKGGIAYPATFVLNRDREVRFRSLDRVATRVDLGGLFAFLGSGLERAPPAAPARSRVTPAARDWLRFASNALRFGIRTPKS